jgi:dephospho-CoA kinase
LLKVAITGNMGSGKSTVCSVFKSIGIPVFNADDAAAFELSNNADVVTKVKQLFGDDIYIDGLPDKKRMAELVFNNKKLLDALNAIVHPATIEHFKKWCTKQQSPYIIKEAAILFESGTDKGVDKIITVTAPESLRIDRILNRNPRWTKEDIKKRLSAQMPESEKVKLSDFVINNDGTSSIIEQVLRIHKSLTAT